MNAAPELYTHLVASAGRLQMRATARLAEGSPDSVFEACVLLHEAARIERRAILALPSPPPVARLAAAVEECFCLVEGFDPAGAARAWARVLDERRHARPDEAAGLLSRLEPRYHRSLREFQSLLREQHTLMAHLRTDHRVPSSRTARAAELADVKRVLARFPGASEFWWRAYRLQEANGSFADAWRSLSHARQLSPKNSTYEALSLLLAVKALPAREADAELQRAYTSLRDAGPAECLLYAHAELERAEGARERERWVRAREAVELGLSKTSTVDLSKNLRATRLIIDCFLAGREPTLDILYEVGLGEEIATAPTGENVIDLVAQRARRQIVAREAAA